MRETMSLEQFQLIYQLMQNQSEELAGLRGDVGKIKEELAENRATRSNNAKIGEWIKGLVMAIAGGIIGHLTFHFPSGKTTP
jgi:hypothetical protein